MSKKTTTAEPIQPFKIESWTQSIIRPTLIILMVTAMMGALLSFLSIIAPHQAWPLTFLICFLVIIESYFTTIWLNQPERRSLHHLKYRAAEILVLAIIIRVLTWGIQGNWPDINAGLYYLKNPFHLLNDGFFWATLIFSLIAWQRVIAISQSFILMQPDEAEKAYYSQPRHKRDPGSQPISDDRSYLLHGYAQQFLGGGLVVLLCAGLASFSLPEIVISSNPFTSGITRLRLSPGMLMSLLLYFLCGFLLLSQGRLAILEIRWLADSVKLKTPIGRHWHRQTLFLLLALGVIAAFLPVGSTLPFMHLMNLILFVIIFAITSLIYLITFIISAFLSLFFRRESTTESLPPIPPPPPPPQQLPPIEANDTLQLIFSSAFWAFALIMTLLAFSFFLRERGVKINNAFLQRMWLTLKLWWQQLRQGINDQLQDIQGGLQSLFEQKPKTKTKSQPPWRFIRVNGLSPRERVHYFYLSTVKRADQRGVTRQDSETPLEFADDLKSNWPDAEEEIDELTDAFLQARYSSTSFEEDDVTPLKKQWKRLKTNLRKRKKENK